MVGEYRREKLPVVEIRERKLIRLACEDRAERTLLIDAKISCRRGAFWNRVCFQHAVALQSDCKRSFRILAVDSAVRLINPTTLYLLLKHCDPGCRIVRSFTS